MHGGRAGVAWKYESVRRGRTGEFPAPQDGDELRTERDAASTGGGLGRSVAGTAGCSVPALRPRDTTPDVESSLLKIHIGPGQRGDLTDARPRPHRREQERLVE